MKENSLLLKTHIEAYGMIEQDVVCKLCSDSLERKWKDKSRNRKSAKQMIKQMGLLINCH